MFSQTRSGSSSHNSPLKTCKQRSNKPLATSIQNPEKLLQSRIPSLFTDTKVSLLPLLLPLFTNWLREQQDRIVRFPSAQGFPSGGYRLWRTRFISDCSSYKRLRNVTTANYLQFLASGCAANDDVSFTLERSGGLPSCRGTISFEVSNTRWILGMEMPGKLSLAFSSTTPRARSFDPAVRWGGVCYNSFANTMDRLDRSWVDGLLVCLFWFQSNLRMEKLPNQALRDSASRCNIPRRTDCVSGSPHIIIIGDKIRCQTSQIGNRYHGLELGITIGLNGEQIGIVLQPYCRPLHCIPITQVSVMNPPFCRIRHLSLSCKIFCFLSLSRLAAYSRISHATLRNRL